MKKYLYPSLMCADFTNIRKEIAELDLADVDGYHMDIMDGQFVPNMALGVEDYRAVRSLTVKPMDVHLMAKNPARFIEIFKNLGANKFFIHPESDLLPSATLKKIKDEGMTPGIAIDPGISVATVQPLLNLVDEVLVMTVNPGFAGQKYLNFVNEKLKELTGLKAKYRFRLSVDGAISPKKVKKLSQLGVDGFVLGTSSLFGKSDNYSKIITSLRKL